MPQFVRRYGLAVCCVVAPIAFALVGVYFADKHLGPAALAMPLPYHAAQAGDGSVPSKNPKLENNAPSVPAAGIPAIAPSEKSPGAGDAATAQNVTGLPPNAQKPNSDALKFWTIGLQYRGRITYAVASAFIFLISGVVFLFGVSVVADRIKWWTLAVVALFAGVGYFCSGPTLTPPGRALVVENLLNFADGFPPYKGVLQNTGDLTISLVKFNTVVSLWSIGIFLWALAVLSLRPESKELDQGELQGRLKWLRVALGLGSTFLVIGVLAQKALMDWPLSLIDKDQAAGLRMLADALTLQVGAQGTIALIAAFGPAITAWNLDVGEWRRQRAKEAQTAQKAQQAKEAQRAEEETQRPKERRADELGWRRWSTTEASRIPPLEEQPAPVVKQNSPQRQSDADDAKGNDGLEFAPMSMIASVFAVLAPLLASPFVDALKSLLGVASP